MGFRNEAYATVWAIDPVSDRHTKIRISIQRRNKETGEFEQEFSGFCSCLGTATARKAAMLKEKDRIKIGDTDVSYFYDKEKGKGFYTFKIWSFEVVPPLEQTSMGVQASVDDGEPDDEDGLPF